MLVRGIAYWAYTSQPDTKWDNHAWTITLEMNKKEAEKLKKLGIKVREEVQEDDSIRRTYKFRRYVKRRDGSNRKNKKPICVDPGKKPFNGIIGNGSEVNVLCKPYDWSYRGRKGVGVDFVGVQIVKLVPYESAVSDDPEKDPNLEGFEIVGESFLGSKEDDETIFGEENEVPEFPVPDEEDDDEEPPF